MENVTELLADYCKNMIIWAHPNTQLNVVPPSSISSILAFIAAAIYNPNIIEGEFSARFAEAEIESISMLSDLIGYDSLISGGIFTFGGAGIIFMAANLGSKKCLVDVVD